MELQTSIKYSFEIMGGKCNVILKGRSMCAGIKDILGDFSLPLVTGEWLDFWKKKKKKRSYEQEEDKVELCSFDWYNVKVGKYMGYMCFEV